MSLEDLVTASGCLNDGWCGDPQVGHCRVCQAKQKADGLESARAAGRREAREEIAAKLRLRGKTARKHAEDVLAHKFADWIERGCP